MSGSIVRRLIVKDLYLARWIIAGSLAGGVVSVAVMPFGQVLSYVGGVSLICTLIILNIVLVLSGIVQERKDKVLLFVLSLPISTAQYTAAKVLATTIAFTGPWMALTAATVAVVTVSDIPNGILPFWLTVLGYLLAYHYVLVAVSLVRPSSGWHATAITLGNVSVNFLIPVLLSRPSVAAHGRGPTAVWSADLVLVLVLEILAGVAAVGAAVYVHSRKPDLV